MLKQLIQLFAEKFLVGKKGMGGRTTRNSSERFNNAHCYR